MHVRYILQKLLGTTIHKTRFKTLLVVIKGLIYSKQMQLTQLGRAIKTQGTERSAIRRVDRFLNNAYYQSNTIEIYKTITRSVIGNKKHPDILVDWSSIPNSHKTPDGEHCLLRASIATQGRSITLYEQVHPKKLENAPKVHKSFLLNLKTMLPENCCPCIITDAGFKNPWFKAVLSHGWNYVGRISGLVQYDQGYGFQTIKSLFNKATKTAKLIGLYSVAKTNPLKTHIYLYKAAPKGRHKYTKSGRIDSSKDSLKHSKRHKEPWVLVSSLQVQAKKIVEKYKRRMQIEESFRDTKSIEYGLSMNNNITLNPKRYIVWLMLAALASYVAWIVGYSAERMNLQYDFQANTYRHRRVLSLFYLGCQVIRKKMNIPINIVKDIIEKGEGMPEHV